MKRTLFIIATLIVTAGIFPRYVLALEDGMPETTSCKTDSYTCSCTKTSDATAGEESTKSTTTDECNTACAKYDSYTLTCTGTNGATKTVGQGSVSLTATPDTESAPDFVVPILNVPIPGLTALSAPTTDGTNVSVSFFAEYLSAVYNWILGAAALVAVVMMMIGGLQYIMSRGKEKYITKAKERITGAITGIILLLLVYNIAFFIDPNTTILGPITLQTVNYVALLKDEPSPSVSSGTTPSASSSDLTSANIICDQKTSLPDIVQSTYGHITFRIGGRYGGHAPYKDQNTKSRMDPNGIYYSTYCPEGQICLDCAGYAQFISQCAGLPSADESGGSYAVFHNAKAFPITSYDNTTVNGKPLQIGDLIGFSSSPYGHVTTYIGNGKVAQNTPPRTPGSGVTINNTISVKAIIKEILHEKGVPYIRYR